MYMGDVVFTGEQIKRRVCALGERISSDYAGRDLTLIGILNGSFVFMADLVRSVTIPVQVDFVRLASYGAKTFSTGQVKLTKDIEVSVEDRDVLVVEDIVDTGHTLRFFRELIGRHNPRSIRICALVSKTERRSEPVGIDYVGFEVQSGFLVGYGLDCNEDYRHLEDIWRLEVNATPESG